MRNLWIIVFAVAFTVVLALGTAPAAFAASSPPAIDAAATVPRVIFADEFDGPLDDSSWATLTPWNTRYTTNELEYYDPSNVTFSDGKMRLTSENRSASGYDYASGIVTSLPREKFSYGYFEIRAKLPKGQGVWPAFWLTNDSTLEIDVFELLGHTPKRQYMTLHINDKTVFQRVYDGPDFSAGYHTYGVDWQPTYVKWYIDGVLRATYAHKMPDDPLWICLNTAVGGHWPGSPDKTTKFPQSFDIDYVRVYDKMPVAKTVETAEQPEASVATQPQRKPLPSAADAPTTYTPPMPASLAETPTPAPAPASPVLEIGFFGIAYGSEEAARTATFAALHAPTGLSASAAVERFGLVVAGR